MKEFTNRILVLYINRRWRIYKDGLQERCVGVPVIISHLTENFKDKKYTHAILFSADAEQHAPGRSLLLVLVFPFFIFSTTVGNAMRFHTLLGISVWICNGFKPSAATKIEWSSAGRIIDNKCQSCYKQSCKM